MKWYEQKWANHRDWILDNIEYLNLSYGEGLLCLILDFMKEKNVPITYESLINKLDTNQDELDKLLFGLKRRGYLNIQIDAKGMSFDLKPLFEFNEQEASTKGDEELYGLFERTFRRPLSPKEMSKITLLAKKYGSPALIVALRSAEAYGKLNMNFVERYLNDREPQD